MTNNSLNGSLRQLGETMASNLTAQGVPSTYDEGLTTLAGKILDIQGGGTFDGISVSSTQDILSYADGDSTVLSAQLTNQGQAVSVSGESVTFEVRKVSDDSLVETLTDTTDSNGLASVEYFGKGSGDLYIIAKCRTLSKTYSNIEDDKLYHTGAKIKSDWNKRTDISGRLIYYLEPLFKSDTDGVLEFKFKNTLPSQYVIGFSNVASNLYSKGCFLNDANNLAIWYDGYTRNTLSNSPTVNSIFKIEVSNNNTIKWYIDDVLVATRTNTGSGKDLPLNLRVDEFTNISYELEYFKIL